jgi:surface protein
MSDWGKGVNNDIGWGQGANNDIGWGSIYDKSNAGETLLKSDLNIDAFIIEVDTSKTGVSNNNQFQFTGAKGDYDVVAKQNGTQVATFDNLSGQETITLPSSSIYVLEVSAKEVNGFNRIQFNNGGDKDKIIDIKQWGDVAWSTFNAVFLGCSNMLTTATDIPNLSNVTNMYFMFRNASSANPDTTNWDVSNVTNMSFMFYNASSANPDTTNWDVSNVTSMYAMFYFATSANPDTTNWNVSNVTDMAFMFENSNLSVNNLTACYENWSQLLLQQNVSFGGGSTKYNASGQEGRDILVNTYNWIIEDGGLV